MKCQPVNSVGLYLGEEFRRYSFGDGHPFGPDRYDRFCEAARHRGLLEQVCILKPVLCEPHDLLRFHHEDHVDFVKLASVHGTGFLDSGDTPAFVGIYDAARYVAGSCLDAVQRILDGELSRVFIPIAGLHHASRDQAAGFCAISDIGVAIETLRECYGIRRILYVDIDAHHGDGVYYSFASDAEVFIADIHEDGQHLYPGTGDAADCGTGEAQGTKLNIPVMPESGDDVFYSAWEKLESFAREASPQFILLQAGADCIAGDPITHLRFSPQVHRHAATRLCQLADEFCGGRILAMGGGGYNRDNLANAWCEVVQALIETS